MGWRPEGEDIAYTEPLLPQSSLQESLAVYVVVETSGSRAIVLGSNPRLLHFLRSVPLRKGDNSTYLIVVSGCKPLLTGKELWLFTAAGEKAERSCSPVGLAGVAEFVAFCP